MAQKRQLLAILFADIQGFTSLMEEDEDQAKIIKDKFHQQLEASFKSFHGRIIGFQGDGMNCIFKSAVEAVMAAIKVQLIMQEEPIVPLRIGIHLGDIIVDEKDIFGDGVNIASRTESFAIPGSVFITDMVYHEIRNHPSIQTYSLGKYVFKNIKQPVEIYAISNEGLVVPHIKELSGKGRAVTGKKYRVMIAAAILLTIVSALFYFNFFNQITNDKSIAVLPFINMNNNPGEDYLSDGFTEDILTSLSNIEGLKVTSFASTRQYKNSNKTIKQIGKELNVAYVLEGSVRRSGDILRITAQLINVKSDAHVWAKNYDETFKKILSIQTIVANEIATVLQTKLSPYEKRRVEKRATLNADAYQLYLKGRYYWNLRTKESLDTSIHFFSGAIKIDPDYALAYSGIADAYTILSDNGFMPVDSVAGKAKAAVDKALALDSSLTEVRSSYAIYLSSLEGNGTAAIRELEKITRNNPNYASAFQWYALELAAKGQFETAREMIEKAVVLDPRSKRIYASKALIYLFSKNINKAIQVLKEAPEGFSNDKSYSKFLADLYYLKGAKDSAQYFAQLCNDELLIAIIKNDKTSFNHLMSAKKKNPKISAEELATNYSIAGEKDSALVWLKKAINNKQYGGLKFLAVSPYWDPLRSDPRFELLLQNSGIH